MINGATPHQGKGAVPRSEPLVPNGSAAGARVHDGGVRGVKASAANAGSAARAASPPQQSWTELARETVDAVLTSIRERGRMVVLEAQQATLAAAHALALAVAAAIFALTAWWSLWAVIVGGMVAVGIGWLPALMASLVANALATWLVARAVKRKLSLMSFERSLQALHLSTPNAPSNFPSGDVSEATGTGTSMNAQRGAATVSPNAATHATR